MGRGDREPHWSDAVAAGRRSFVERIREELRNPARHRHVEDEDRASILREREESYGPHSGTEMNGGCTPEIGLEFAHIPSGFASFERSHHVFGS